jgi:hypothetical protein
MTGPMIMLIGGGGLFGYLIFDTLQYRRRKRAKREEPEDGMSAHVSYDWRVYMVIAVTLLLTFLYGRGIERQINEDLPGIAPEYETFRSVIVAVYLLCVGLYWAWRQARKEGLNRKGLISQQVADLVTQFKSVFRIRPTVFNALEEANRKIDPPVGNAVAHAVTTFYVTSLPARAFGELRERVQDPYMDQFIYILQRGEDAKHEDIMTALEGLQKRIRSARELRDQSEVNMTMITGQTRIIQIIAVLLIVVVGALPTFRSAYESLVGQLLFMFISTIGVWTSFYIDRKAAALKDKVL